MANLHSYIAQVDGDSVQHAQDPGRSVVIAEGKRFITLACTLGGATGWSSVPIDIKAGQVYRAKCEVVKNGMFDRVPYAWLEDDSGKTIIEKRQAPFQPLSGGTIPIFIPIHR